MTEIADAPEILNAAANPLRASLFRSHVRRIAVVVLSLVLCMWTTSVLVLVTARWIDPLTTVVHVQRRIQSWIERKPYREHYKFIPLSQISLDLQHAVIAAEDSRFYQHHGFDWGSSSPCSPIFCPVYWHSTNLGYKLELVTR